MQIFLSKFNFIAKTLFNIIYKRFIKLVFINKK